MCLRLVVGLAIFISFYETIFAQQTCSEALPTVCASISYLCNNSLYQSYMAQNCPVTCKLCTPSATTSIPLSQCVDSLTTCQLSSSLCTNSIYQSFMNQYCPKTCNFCPSADVQEVNATTIGPCVDKDLVPDVPSSCSAYPSLCDIQVFQETMQEYCPKTCGYCSDSVSE